MGQSSIASYNGIHAIVGARIEIGDGRVLEKGTVIIKNGLIVAVAVDAAVPRGAEVLDGKGLTVYPGFIDGYTTKGFTAPAARPAETDQNADNPNYASAFMRETVRVGIRPEIQAAENLSLTDEVLKGYQTNGFTTIMVVPSGGDISGVSALVNLSGRPTRECVVLPRFAESIGFSGPSGSYPSSLMGHIAQVRQTLIDANWLTKLDKSFQAGGGTRPPTDPSLSALLPLLSGKLPAIYDADNSAQIGRALTLSSEFGMRSVLAGGTEAWKRIEDIKAAGAPVLVALSFGAEPGTSPAKPDAPKPVDAKQDAAKTELSTADPENPAEIAERKRLYEETLKNASLLASSGIPMAFTTKGTASTTVFLENLRKAVKAGLSKEAALKSLTIDAAKIFGVDRQLGTVEAGKIANVIVTSTDFLDPQMKVKMLYIDGRKIDPSKAKTPPTFRFQFHEDGGN